MVLSPASSLKRGQRTEYFSLFDPPKSDLYQTMAIGLLEVGEKEHKASLGEFDARLISRSLQRCPAA